MGMSNKIDTKRRDSWMIESKIVSLMEFKPKHTTTLKCPGKSEKRSIGKENLDNNQLSITKCLDD